MKVKAIAEAQDRRGRIERLIEHYRVAKQHRLTRRAKRLWRRLQGQQRLATLDKPPGRVH